MVRALAVLVMTVAMASASAQSARTESFGRFLRDNGIDPETFVMEPGPFGIARFQIHVHHHLSIPCEGPRGCYAKSDLLDVSVSCPVRAAMIHRRTSFDLNGNVVAVAESVPPPAARFTIPRAESLEARVVTILCGDSPYVR